MNIWINILYYVDYFLVYSVIGWILESIYKTLLEKRIVNSGFLFGPVCPIYGAGALIMYAFLSGYNSNPVHIFFLGFVILSIWEYIVAWFLEKIFHEKYWDYSNNRFNINGRVCLLNSAFWGVLGLIFIYIVHPFIEKQILNINIIFLISVTIISIILMLIDTVINAIKLINVPKKLETVKKLRNEIKNRLLELKSMTDIKINNKEKLQQIIAEMKEKESKLREKLVNQTERIRKAFPTMKSETFKQISKYRRKQD